MRSLLAVVTLLAGCRQLLGIDDRVPGHADAASDGPRDATASDGGGDGAGGCPASFVTLAGQPHVYKLVTVANPWTTQHDTCAQASPNAYLAIPDGASELQAITSLSNADLWIGIDDLMTENVFVTVLGPVATFLPWATNQPDNALESDCVRIVGGTQQYDDDRCALSFAAVCECVP